MSADGDTGGNTPDTPRAGRSAMPGGMFGGMLQGVAADVLRGVKPCDWALLLLLLAATLWGMALVSGGAAASAEVLIEVDNRPLYRFQLSVDRTIEAGGLTVEIKGRKVRVLTAECPNKLCVKQGWIEHGAIICVPLKTVITIKGGATPGDKRGATPGDKGAPDAITG